MKKWILQDTHKFFLLGLAIKGLNGFAELLGGFLAWFSSPNLVQEFAMRFVREELYEDPADFVMNFILKASDNVSVGDLKYVALFLILHGIIKLVLIWFLFKGKIKAYPIAIFVFASFAIYQVMHFVWYQSTVDIFLTIFDLIIIALTYFEYERLKKISF